ncbi:MAG: endolytic transglycosylase MltG [Candidatus Moraniibacteriota bacterium]
MRIFLIIAFSLSVLSVGIFFYLSYRETNSHGVRKETTRFEVNQGENVFSLSKRLEDERLISSRFIMMWHLARIGKTHALVAGTYALNGTLSVTEIAFMITEGKVLPRDIKITFPEGWNSKKMSERLTANGLPGADFLALVKKPKPDWKTQFDFLADLPKDASLEGFLFPDTYFFVPEASAETIVEKLLSTFGKKLDASLRAKAVEQKHSIFETVTLASIVENEVKSMEDRKIVADIFLRRIATGQALQSCATLQYILGVDKKQYSFDETRTPSPYNTYINTGLPPGPIGNPGLVSLQATLSPQSNNNVYFLSDPKTGKTIFSVTYEEHVKNKNLYGL